MRTVTMVSYLCHETTPAGMARLEYFKTPDDQLIKVIFTGIEPFQTIVQLPNKVTLTVPAQLIAGHTHYFSARVAMQYLGYEVMKTSERLFGEIDVE